MTTSEINAGRVCTYCGGTPKLIDSAAIYGTSYGLVWACLPCDAWVGVHKGTNVPFGRLANAQLREWKILAHAAFDPLWLKKMKQGVKKATARNAAYDWLAGEMNIPRDICHIGMFDEEQCRQVVDICQKFYQRKTNSSNG